MKKKLLLVLGIVCCVAFAGCKGNGSANPTPANGSTPTPEPTQMVNYDIEFEPIATPTISPTPVLSCRTIDQTHMTTAEDGTTVLTGLLNYPKFVGLDEDTLNQEVSKTVDEYLANLEQEGIYAKEEYEEAKKSGETFTPQMDTLMMSVSGMDDVYISLLSIRYTELGGPHPNTVFTASVIDRAGKQVSLDDFLAAKGCTATAKIVADYAATVFEARNDGEENVFTVTKPVNEAVLELIERNHWYFSEKGITVFANTYELAPHAYGTYSVDIPYSQLTADLK